MKATHEPVLEFKLQPVELLPFIHRPTEKRTPPSFTAAQDQSLMGDSLNVQCWIVLKSAARFSATPMPLW